MISIALAVVAGCAAGSQSFRQRQDTVSGHWTGAIDRDGWQRPLSLSLTNENGVYGGSWMSIESQPGMMLDRVDVDGDAVRFQLSNLDFVGRVSGRSLTGSVTDTVSGKSSGQFALTRVDPRTPSYP